MDEKSLVDSNFMENYKQQMNQNSIMGLRDIIPTFNINYKIMKKQSLLCIEIYSIL